MPAPGSMYVCRGSRPPDTTGLVRLRTPDHPDIAGMRSHASRADGRLPAQRPLAGNLGRVRDYTGVNWLARNRYPQPL